MGRGQASAQPCGAAEQPDSSSASHPMCQELWEVMGPAGHRSCSSPLGFHGALRQCRPWPCWGLRPSGEPSSAALSRTQPQAGLGLAPGAGTCDVASVTMSDALRKAVPVGSFFPRAGALVILCLFGSHHDTYVLHRV